MKIFQKMCASTVIITTLLGTGGTINSVYADSIEQQSKLGIEQETDKQIIVKFKADLDLPYEDGIEKQIQSQTNDKIIKDSFDRISRCNIYSFIHICKPGTNTKP